MYLLRIFQYANKFCVPSVSWKTIRKSEILQTLNIKKQWRKKFMLQCRIQLVGGLYNKECFNSLRPHKLSKPHFLVLLSHKVTKTKIVDYSSKSISNMGQICKSMDNCYFHKIVVHKTIYGLVQINFQWYNSIISHPILPELK